MFGFEKQLLWKTDNYLFNLTSLNEFESTSESVSGYIFVNLLSFQTFTTQRMETEQQPENRGHMES